MILLCCVMPVLCVANVVMLCVSGIGLLYVDASVWQMLRGSIIIFAGILSVSETEMCYDFADLY